MPKWGSTLGKLQAPKIPISQMAFLFFIYGLSMLGTLICASLLTRDFHRHHREEWELAERPIGPLWAPSGQREELLSSLTSRSMRMGTLLHLNLLLFPPDATGYPMRAAMKPVLYAYRLLSLATVVLLVATLIGG